MTALGQRGSALVAALGLLCAMTLLGTMSLMAGGADLLISTRRARQRSVFYAAESALETTFAELAGGECAFPEASFHTPWPAPGIEIREWQDGPWGCRRRICLIPDVADADGDSSTTVVLFNRSFGYSSSPLESGGYPVVQALVTARGGESHQSIVAEVAPVTCVPRIAAAWTVAGRLELAGDIRVSGTAMLPAIAGSDSVSLLGGAAIDGDQVVESRGSLPADVLDLLGAGGSLSKLENLPEPPGEGVLDGVYWSRGNFSAPLTGKGILVVHNPAFDPAKHEASRLAIEEGLIVEGRDPTYSHLDPSRQPARLDMLAGGAFSGLIVADTIGGASAAFTLTGALVTLSQSPLTVASSFPLRIEGSREAVAGAGRGELRVLAGFRPVTVSPESLGACP